MKDAAVVIADRSGVIVYWSEGAEVAFGHAATKAVGQSLELIVPNEHHASHWNGFRRAMESGSAAGEGYDSGFPVRAAHGEVVETPGRLTLVRGPGGQVVGAMVVFVSGGQAGT